MYYGNNEWAGLKTGDKTAPYYHATSNLDTNFLFDDDFCTGEINRVGAGTLTTKSGYLGELISEFNTIAQDVGLKALTVARKGGITTTDHAKLVRAIGWLPIHAAKQDHFFEDSYGELETMFKELADSYVKSSVTLEGRVAQQGSFAWEEAPFSGELPSDIFQVCSDMIEFAQLKGDGYTEQKYLTIAGGLLV